MTAVRGLTLAFVLFATSFALHIVAGATNQGWLFALAVVLIYASAAAFPWFATLFAGRRSIPVTVVGSVAGVAFSFGALWATNGRTFAWWEIPLAAVLVVVTNAAAFRLFGEPAAAERRPARARS